MTEPVVRRGEGVGGLFADARPGDFDEEIFPGVIVRVRYVAESSQSVFDEFGAGVGLFEQSFGSSGSTWGVDVPSSS